LKQRQETLFWIWLGTTTPPLFDRRTWRRSSKAEPNSATFGGTLVPNRSIYDVPGSTAVAVKDLVAPQIIHANAGIELPRIHPNLVMKEELN
jgi:hypothetical protein